MKRIPTTAKLTASSLRLATTNLSAFSPRIAAGLYPPLISPA